MSLLKILWAANFFFFALILLFVWSKIYIISKKVLSVSALVEKADALAQQLEPSGPAKQKPDAARVKG